ncbi:hypothetical protein CRUP_005438 [Coryphaenoides rupestris]|nr:hypothetical protein CRUP_005438 [Coryphaenoides rupestris]
MKRIRRLSSSSDESDHGSNSTCWSQQSQTTVRRSTGLKPSEVFRTDLITAMKVHDSQCLSAEDFYILADPWRQDWEKGVQVPVNPHSLPQPTARVVCAPSREAGYTRPKKRVRASGSEDIRSLADATCRYDLNEDDQAWLLAVNQELREMGVPLLDEITMETVMEVFEQRCHDNMSHAMQTEEGLGIEYDDDVVCEVCHSPDGEDNNEMVFCDKCNICVHQITMETVMEVFEQRCHDNMSHAMQTEEGLGIEYDDDVVCEVCHSPDGEDNNEMVFCDKCNICVHQVSIGNPEKMEPITNVSHIPSSRWALLCCVCQDKTGACIQCSAKNCRAAFHVTCGLQAKLQMITFLTEEDEVKFKSYCPKHSGPEEQEGEGVADKRSRRRGLSKGEEEEQEEEKRGNLRKLKLAGGREEACGVEERAEARCRGQRGGTLASNEACSTYDAGFSSFVGVEEGGQQSWACCFETGCELHPCLHLRTCNRLRELKTNRYQCIVQPDAVGVLFSACIDKRKEEDSLARREQEVLLRRLQLFTHLRQDLERVSIGNPEKMEPITNVSHIPSSRWALLCCVCQDKTGACIQCSAKNCRAAFHVTCGLQAKLQMITFLTEEDEVKFKSYCPKHSGPEEQEGEGVADKRSRRRGLSKGEEEEQEEEKRGNLRKLKLQQLEEEFSSFVEVEEVAQQLGVSAELVDFLFQYWKLKRKANFNLPLLAPKKEEEDSLARREQEVLLRRLQLFTHLRQDLERVRNLSYMVTRREKLKRSLCRLQEQMFLKQLLLLDQQLLRDDPSTRSFCSSSSSAKCRRWKPDRRSRRRSATGSPPRTPKSQEPPDQSQGPPDQSQGPPEPQEVLQRGGGEEDEQEDKRGKAPGPRRLERTVCIRLVDICLRPPRDPDPWGSVRVPRRGERRSRTRLNTRAPPTPLQVPPTGREEEPRLERCQSHRLRRDATLCRHYGNHIVRQGVLAS